MTPRVSTLPAALLAALLMLPLGAGAQVSTPSQLPANWTLDQVLNRILAENHTIRRAKLDIESSEGAVVEARAVLYPQIHANASGGATNDDLLGRDNDSNNRFRADWRSQLRVTYSLYSGGKNSNNISAASLARSREFLRYAQTVNQTLHDAKQLFYRVLLHAQEVEIQQEIVKLLENEVSRQKSLFEAGRTTKFNILRTEVRLENERPKLQRARLNLQQAGLDLAGLMQLPLGKNQAGGSLRVEGALECPPYTLGLDDAIRTALARRPDRQILDQSREIEEKRAKVARASNIPTVDAFSQGTVRRDNDDDSSAFEHTTEIAFGLLAQWDIFDGFSGKGEARQAEARAEQFSIELGDVERRITNEVQRNHAALTHAAGILTSQRDNVARARESLRLAYSAVEAGFGNQLDILQATVDLNESRTNEARAKYEYHAALAGLERTLFIESNWSGGGGTSSGGAKP